MNADDTEVLKVEQDSLIQDNLYIYALNNPVNMMDDDGDIAFFIVTGIVGAVVGGIVGYAKTGTLKGTLTGAAIGGAIGLTGGAIGAKLLAGSAVAKTGAVIAGGKTALALGSMTATMASQSTQKASVSTRNHIMQAKHLWNTIGVKSWSAAQSVIKYVLTKGTSASYGSSGAKIFTAKYGGKVIQVTGKFIDGIFRISDAWVKK